MILCGLTGSIGMGKSTTLAMFEEEGAAVWDADAAVHRLYAEGGAAVRPVSERFPGVLGEDGGVDRAALGKEVLGNKEALVELEAIVHPLVRQDQEAFLAQARADVAVLDIPLLAETSQAERFDVVVVVTADEEVRQERVLARPGMTDAKLGAILARQLPESERLKLADYVVRTDRGLEEARQEVRRIMLALREKNRLS
ncbi:dephospho-CoA kinase [Parvularcula maris]|uniref:Dephospho-CoA kinase n=1 Tax=Parvularcula maris TaxID=2965077 RepID=A0A9X2RG85_9PROT|nr:dephospho-CoA kinase [Parvularcula maris]